MNIRLERIVYHVHNISRVIVRCKVQFSSRTRKAHNYFCNAVVYLWYCANMNNFNCREKTSIYNQCLSKHNNRRMLQQLDKLIQSRRLSSCSQSERNGTFLLWVNIRLEHILCRVYTCFRLATLVNIQKLDKTRVVHNRRRQYTFEPE